MKNSKDNSASLSAKHARSSNTKSLVFCALFVAITAVCSWLAIPQPFSPVPINLGLLAVMLCGTLLGVKLGVIAVCAYILLGAIGVPVFVGFGATASLFGATGGFIFGYVPAAVIAGLSKNKKTPLLVTGLVLSVLSCYLFGTLWYMRYAYINFIGALVACVLPFIMGDIFKIIVATILTKRLAKQLPQIR